MAALADTELSRQLSRELGNARDTLAWMNSDTSSYRRRYVYARVTPPVPAKPAGRGVSDINAYATDTDTGAGANDLVDDGQSEALPDKNGVVLTTNGEHGILPAPPSDWLVSDQKCNVAAAPANITPDHLLPDNPGVIAGRESFRPNIPLAAILQDSINSPQLKAKGGLGGQSDFATNNNNSATSDNQAQLSGTYHSDDAQNGLNDQRGSDMPVTNRTDSLPAGQVFTVEGHTGPGYGSSLCKPPIIKYGKQSGFSDVARCAYSPVYHRIPSPVPTGTSNPAAYNDAQASTVVGGSLVFGHSGRRSKSDYGDLLGVPGSGRNARKSPHVSPSGLRQQWIELPQFPKAGPGVKESGYVMRFRRIAEDLARVELPPEQQWQEDREMLRARGLMTSPEDRLREHLSRFSQALLKLCHQAPPLGPDGEFFKRNVWIVANAFQEHLENNCAKCGQPIGGGRPGCSALDKTYHLECFVCNVCNGRLAGGSFYSVDGKPYCEKDYMDTLEKCNVCQKPIMDRILRASGKPYHPQCFTCTACSKSLDGIPFTVDSNNAIHCVDCFHEKYAPRCARCSKPIVPEEGKEESLRVVAMDKSFHVDCYRCEDCNKSLNSKIDGHGCYPLDDHILCKDCNIVRVQAMSK